MGTNPSEPSETDVAEIKKALIRQYLMKEWEIQEKTLDNFARYVGGRGLPIGAHLSITKEQVKAKISSSRIQKPPGFLISAVATFVLTKGAYQRYVYPHLADTHHEFIEAIAGGENKKAQWIRIRGCGLIIWSLLTALPRSIFGALVGKFLG